MRIEHPFPWHRIAHTLEAAPIVIKNLIDGISDTEADFRPDEERMTIREIVPHLASWDLVAFRHLQRTCFEDAPLLDDCEHDILLPAERVDMDAQLTLFSERRSATVSFLRTLSIEDWGKEAKRMKYGPTTLDAQVFIIVMHDTYHIRQIVEWRDLFTKRQLAQQTE